MIAEGLLSSVAKVAVVAGLTAGGAAGVYFVATRSGIGNDHTPSAGIVATETVTSEGTATPGSDTPTPAAGEIATPTPIPGLTDTGYVALDGRPLYAECIQPGAPLPPQIPTPSGDFASPTPPPPGFDPNQGKPPPAPESLPAFDPRSVPSADTSGWNIHDSACYGYSVALPPGWTFSSAFLHAGYQQGEGATLHAPDNRAKVDLYVQYSPFVDPLRILSEGFGYIVPETAYILDAPAAVTQDGKRGALVYFYENAEQETVVLGYDFALRPGWNAGVGVRLYSPYDPAIAAQARAIVDSLRFQ